MTGPMLESSSQASASTNRRPRPSGRAWRRAARASTDISLRAGLICTLIALRAPSRSKLCFGVAARPLTDLAGAQGVDGEQAVRVGPDAGRHPAAGSRQRLKRRDAVLVAVLRVDGFAFLKADPAICHAHILRHRAAQVHFDAA